MIRYHSVLRAYILKHFLFWNAVLLCSLSFIAGIFNLIELIRRTQGNASISFGQLLKLTFFQLPTILDQLTPLIVLFSTMIFLWILHKRSEIIVMRSLGYSIWALISPMILGVFIYSLLYFFLINPFTASLKEEHLHYQDQVFQKTQNLSSVSKSGLWLKHQKQDNDYSIIHVERILSKNVFGRSVIYDFDANGLFIKRYDVEKIHVHPTWWDLEQPTITESNDIQKPIGNMTLDLQLTLEKIEKTFQAPSSLSFWQLPGFISLIEKTGLSGDEHKLYFFNLLMKPFLLIAMVFIGGVCAFASLRGRDGFVFILSGIFSGFSLHFLHQVFYALGTSFKIPLFFASLTPTVLSLLVGLILLMHLEEG